MAAGAIEQAHAEILLEGFDLKSDGGLRKEQQFRGFSKAEVLANGAKDLQSKVLQLCH
jgi:hypothetical protein